MYFHLAEYSTDWLTDLSTDFYYYVTRSDKKGLIVHDRKSNKYTATWMHY